MSSWTSKHACEVLGTVGPMRHERLFAWHVVCLEDTVEPHEKKSSQCGSNVSIAGPMSGSWWGRCAGDTVSGSGWVSDWSILELWRNVGSNSCLLGRLNMHGMSWWVAGQCDKCWALDLLNSNMRMERMPAELGEQVIFTNEAFVVSSTSINRCFVLYNKHQWTDIACVIWQPIWHGCPVTICFRVSSGSCPASPSCTKRSRRWRPGTSSRGSQSHS